MRVLLPLLLVALAPPSAILGQQDLLERWTVGYLAGGWSLRWGEPDSVVVGVPGEDPTRVSIRIGAQALRIRSAFEQSQSSARLTIRQSLGDVFAARVTAGSDTWRTRTSGRTLVETPRSQAVAAGLEFADSIGALGLMRVSAMAGWDSGSGGEVRLSNENGRYDWTITVWRTQARGSRVFLPADSLREIGVSQVASGARVGAGVTLGSGDVTLRPRGLWEYESLDGRESPPDAFLLTSPAGRAIVYEVAMDATFELWGLTAAYRSRELDLDGTLYRSGASAGRIFFADVEFKRWSAGLHRLLDGVRWSVLVTGERASGDLSTRVETWPFVDLWEQLVTLAYRLRGSLDARSLSVYVRRQPLSQTGWSWSAGAGRYVVDYHRDSWFVTGLGFGRSDQEQSAVGVHPAIVLGGEVSRSFPVGVGRAGVRIDGGVPVYAKETRDETGVGGAGPGDRDVAGYVGVSVTWWW